MGFISLIRMSTGRGAQQIFGTNAATIGGVGEPGAGEFTGGIGWTPFDILLKNIRWSLGAALDPTKSAFIHFKKNNNTALGSQLEIDNPATEASVDLEQTAPAMDTGNVAGTQNYLSTWTTNPASLFGTVAVEYLYSAVPFTSFYQAGQDFGPFTIGNQDRFGAFNANFNLLDLTESNVQTPWPSDGTFKLCAVAFKGSASTTVQLALRKNGVDTGLVFTLAFTGVFQGVTDLTTTVAVVAGDLLSWRISRTAGAGTSANIIVGLGFS